MKTLLPQRRGPVLNIAEVGAEGDSFNSAPFAKTLIHFLFALSLLFQLLVPHNTFAHSELIHSDPAPGETIGPDHKGIRLEFSEPVSKESQILLFTSDFTSIPLTTYPDELFPNRIYAPVSNLQSGKYIVQWTAVSPDGHQIEGSYQFRVINPSYIIHPTTLFLLFSLIVLIAIIIFWRRKIGNGRNHPKPTNN